jgi:hypothetical protein
MTRSISATAVLLIGTILLASCAPAATPLPPTQAPTKAPVAPTTSAPSTPKVKLLALNYKTKDGGGWLE